MKKMILLVMMLIISSISVFGLNNTVLVSPATDGTIASGSGLYTINITYGNPENLSVSCALYITSVSTANTTFYMVTNISNANAQNITMNQSNTTINFSSIIFEDATDYNFYASCSNTTAVTTDNNTGVTIDITVPTAPTASSTVGPNERWTNTEVITFNVGDATTTSCQFLFDNQPVITGTYATSTCTYTFDRFTLPDGIYNNVRVRASDGTNTTDSSAVTVWVDIVRKSSSGSISGTAEVDSATAQQLTNSGSNTQTGVIVILLLLAGYYFFVNKK